MSIRLDALPALTQAVAALADLARAYGITFTLADFGGTRTQADTAQILSYRDADYAVYVRNATAAGITPVSEARFRPIAPWGRSFHDFGAARDLSITSAPPTMTEGDALAVLGSLAGDVGLRWGGNFSNPDPAHFELDESLDDAAAQWYAYTNGTNQPGANVSSGALGGARGGASIGVLLVLAAIVAPLIVRALRNHS